MLDNNYVVLGIIVVVGLLAYFFFQKNKTEPGKAENPVGNNAVSLQLQAYERLTLLSDRLAIPNLIGRTSYDGLNAREMQLVLTRSIRDEFEYNITQQIYVTAETWNAVKNLKEKNLLVINQVAAQLPATATGLDLNRALLEYLMHDDKANMHELVSQALSYEAKKLM